MKKTKSSKKKKSVRTVRTSASEIDKQIGEAVHAENAEAKHMASTSAEDTNFTLTPMEAAVLNLDRDLSNIANSLAEMEKKIQLFGTFIRSLQSTMSTIVKGEKL